MADQWLCVLCEEALSAGCLLKHLHYVTKLGVNVSQCIITLICLFIVMQKSMMKYITSIGQNTGTLKASKNVQIMAMMMPFVAECLPKEVIKEVVKTAQPDFKLHTESPGTL